MRSMAPIAMLTSAIIIPCSIAIWASFDSAMLLSPRDLVAEHTTERWQLPDKGPARAAGGPKGPVRLGYLSMPDSREARKPKCAINIIGHKLCSTAGIHLVESKTCTATFRLLDIITKSVISRWCPIIIRGHVVDRHRRRSPNLRQNAPCAPWLAQGCQGCTRDGCSLASEG